MTDRRQPLLTGIVAREAREALSAISSSLARVAPARVRDPSLAGGAAGVALFHTVAETVQPEAGHARRARRWIERVVELAGEQDLSAGLFDGAAGVGWMLSRFVGADAEDDPAEAIDEALSGAFERGAWRGELDVVTGLAGVMLYARARLPRPAARALLTRSVAEVAAQAIKVPGGTGWVMSRALMTARGESTERGAHVDLGIAHGVSGLLVALAGARCAGVEVATVDRLLGEAVPWLLAQRRPGEVVEMPASVCDAVPTMTRRSAWCYGDAGVAAALLAVARAVDEPSWEREARSLAHHAAKLSVAQSGVIDAGLCHGAASLGHVFHRMWRETGDDVLRSAAKTWLRRCVTMRAPGRGFGGYRAWIPDETGGRWISDLGWLMGTAGVGLALASALSAGAPDWDEALALSIGRATSGSRASTPRSAGRTCTCTRSPS